MAISSRSLLIFSVNKDKSKAKRMNNALFQKELFWSASALTGQTVNWLRFAPRNWARFHMKDFKNLAQSILDKAVADNIADKDAYLAATSWLMAAR